MQLNKEAKDHLQELIMDGLATPDTTENCIIDMVEQDPDGEYWLMLERGGYFVFSREDLE